jgi:hypothetical protein
MKKITLLLLIVFSLSAQRYAMSQVTLTAGTIISTASVGQTVTIPISATVASITPVNSITLDITFDPAIALPTLVTSGSGLTGGAFTFGDLNGVLTISWYDGAIAHNLATGTSVIFNVVFTKVATGITDLVFTFNELILNSPNTLYTCAYAHGKLTYQSDAPHTVAPILTSCSGQSVSIPVLVSDFNTIGAVSLRLLFDPTVLTYTSSTINSGLSISITNLVSGRITVGGSITGGATLPNGTTLLTLNFTYHGGSSNLTWQDDLVTTCEYGNEVGDALPDTPFANYYTNGSVGPSTTTTWTGSTSTAWATLGNWSCDVPSALTDVIIGTATNYPVIPAAADITVKSLTINAGSVTVSATAKLTVLNALTNAVGNTGLVLKSDASGTGSLIHNTAGVAASVERYILAGTWADGTDGWHLLSSPVAAQAINPVFNTDATGYDFYAWSETDQLWLNQKEGANNITSFNIGQGYLVAYATTATKVFSGALNTADKLVTLTKHAGTYTGWNLLGNPYSSALTWNTGWTLTNIGAVSQIWNEGIKDYSLISAGGTIPATNGFMVYTDAASQTLTIPAAARVHSGTAWYKSAAQQIELIAHDPQGESAKSSFIGFDPKATAGFDLDYDAYLLSGYAPKFYSVAGGSEFSLNTLPEAVSNLTIPFGFVKNASSSFSIELAQSIEGHSVWLRDLKTNTVVNLSEKPGYSFTSAEGDNASRFEIVLDMANGTSDLKALASAYAYSVDNRIVVAGVNGETKMDVISIQGQVLNTFEFFSTGQHDVSVNLSTGVYLVRLYNSGEIRTMKVMVK